ncbi:MAG: YraN family protein [Deltaproteobacteria bacterium]
MMHRKPRAKSSISPPSAKRPDPRVPRGRAAEEAAARWLAERGYRLLERNVRLAGAEIDLIAVHDDCFVFIEVRSRSNTRFGNPVDSVDWRKQTRIARVADAWLQVGRRRLSRSRFDVVGVLWERGRPVFSLVVNAFRSPR